MIMADHLRPAVPGLAMRGEQLGRIDLERSGRIRRDVPARLGRCSQEAA